MWSFLRLAKGSFAFWFGGIWFLGGAPFLIAGIAIGIDTFRQQRGFESEARVATGMVLTKRISRSKDSPSASYYVGYRFHTGDGTAVRNEVQVGEALWDRLVEREPVEVTYLPGRPQVNRIVGEGPDWILPGIFTLLGLVFAGIGGFILSMGLRGIFRELKLHDAGAPVEATVVEVGPGNVSFNGVAQWRVVYRYRGPGGQTHRGESALMAPEKAQAWKPGDKGTARFDTRAPKKSVWVDKA